MPHRLKALLASLSALLVIVIGTVIGTNLVTAAPGTVTVFFNYNGATSGDSVISATPALGASADAVLPIPVKSGLVFTGWFNTPSLLAGQRITTINGNDSGTLAAGYVPPELAQTLNLLLPPPPPPPSCANGGAPCALGQVGPGGGMVFLISGGKTYEMAPKTWSESGTPDAGIEWCNDFTSNVSGAKGTDIGSGSTNTTAMDAACTSGAGQKASDYAGGAKTDWFLPSKEELNAMCNYSRNPAAPPTGICPGSQDPTFAIGTYGFASDTYWSSSQPDDSWTAFSQEFLRGGMSNDAKSYLYRVRPIRSFPSA